MTVIIEDIKRKKHKKAKVPGRGKLIKLADKLMSRLVRQMYANTEGVVRCFTCDYRAHWKHMQNGHYISRSRYFTRWMLENTRPQCFVCNLRYQGMGHLFRAQLVVEYGERGVITMEELSKRENQEYTNEMIELVISEFKSLLSNYE